MSGNLTRNAVQQALYGSPRLPYGRRSRPSTTARTAALRDLAAFNLSKFADVQQLFQAFEILRSEGGAAAGEDGLTYRDFARGEVMEGLRAVSEALRQKQYRAYPSLPVDISKGRNTAETRTLHLQRIMDRVVAKTLQLQMDRFCRSNSPRYGKGVWDVFVEMQRVMRSRKAYWLAVDDVKNCFPSVPINVVMDCCQQYISQPDLLWLIETVIRGTRCHGNPIGLEQGSPASPFIVEIVLHTRLDTRFNSRYRGFPLLLRYVDNLNIVCSSERECHDALQRTRDNLAESGLSLKGKDGLPWDLRTGPETKVLGLLPSWNNGRLCFDIPDSAYEDVEEGFHLALQTPHPAETAKAVVIGWLNAVGPALTRAAKDNVTERMMTIARSYGFTELWERDLLAVATEARHRWVEICERKI